MSVIGVDADGSLDVAVLPQAVSMATNASLLRNISFTAAPVSSILDDQISGTVRRGYKILGLAQDRSLRPAGDAIYPLTATVDVFVSLPLQSFVSTTTLTAKESQLQLFSSIIGILGLMGLFRMLHRQLHSRNIWGTEYVEPHLDNQTRGSAGRKRFSVVTRRLTQGAVDASGALRPTGTANAEQSPTVLLSAAPPSQSSIELASRRALAVAGMTSSRVNPIFRDDDPPLSATDDVAQSALRLSRSNASQVAVSPPSSFSIPAEHISKPRELAEPDGATVENIEAQVGMLRKEVQLNSLANSALREELAHLKDALIALQPIVRNRAPGEPSPTEGRP